MSGPLHIREAEADDRAAILALLKAAFGRVEEARLVQRLWMEDAVALELAAFVDGALAGYCAFTLVAADPPLKGVALGLAPLAVAPPMQKQGVGAALVETGLETCEARGASLVVVLGEPDYYSRFGFSPARAKNITWAAMDAGDAFQIIDYANLPATPARRIRYHPAFEEV
ncbi:MAG: N-acetyltransferase [Amphiplicatus sp.]